MTNTESVLAGAGWYDDPADAQQQRWWDGERWTAMITHETPSAKYVPGSLDGEYVPMSRHRRDAHDPVRARRISTSTVSAWLIALSPLLQLAIDLVIVFGAPRQATWTNFGLIAIAFALVTILLANSDRRQLIAFGHTNTASPWLVLLTPLSYLIVRGIRCHRQTWRGLGPVWGHVATLIAVPAVFAAARMGGTLLLGLEHVGR